jgi:oxazoline/thiazoline dehydrogenase
VTSEPLLWTYGLPPDVKVEPSLGGAFLRTPGNRMWIEPADVDVIKHLAGAGASEAQLQHGLQSTESHTDVTIRCAALLFRLDRAGFLARSLVSCGRRLASCVPLRAPARPEPQFPPELPVRLSQYAVARAEANAVCLEVPGSWARMTIHERDLLPLLHDLAIGKSVDELERAVPTVSGKAVSALLALMSWCDLFDRSADEAWSPHDLLFHARTRAGYARGLRGKTDAPRDQDIHPAPGASADGIERIPLARPDLPRLLAEDPPYALVSERRRSVRRQGSTPPTSAQLSEFLFRTLHQRGGRRPYPSGGACYPLKSYVAVHRCLGIAPGLYAYDPVSHELITVSEPGPGFERLLAEAAGAAAVDLPPQILVVLAAQYVRMHRIYPDIGYGLILKEVGAVFQAAMMAAAAMGLSTCPLGCGNALLFSELVGVSPLIESSVGELMLGSLAESG